MRRILLSFLFIAFVKVGYSQVLISLLFGEKLNSPGVEFGLDGGINWANFSSLESNFLYRKFNLGFYFTFKLKQSDHWYLRTGVMVKSDRGTDKLSENDVIKIDSTFLVGDKGQYFQEIGYFDVPFLIRYKFKFKGFLELGPQLSLKNSATLYYTAEDGNDDLTIERSNKESINTFDAGLLVGAGYSLRETKGVSFALWYYYGFNNVYKHVSGVKARSITIKMTIPIGAAKDESKGK